MIFSNLTTPLQALDALLSRLTAAQFTQPVVHLANETIGSHTRHIIELLQCLLRGYATGTADYCNRTRNLTLATDKAAARAALQQLYTGTGLPDKPLLLVTEPGDTGTAAAPVTTSFFREVVYNAEHAIHHMALIKVGLIELGLAHLVAPGFGVAASTMRYKRSGV